MADLSTAVPVISDQQETAPVDSMSHDDNSDNLTSKAATTDNSGRSYWAS